MLVTSSQVARELEPKFAPLAQQQCRILLFTGVAPDLLDSKLTAGTNYDGNYAVYLSTLLSNYTPVINYNDAFNVQVDSSRLWAKCSAGTGGQAITAASTPTWGLLIFGQSTGFNEYALMFSVGNESSNADMKIFGGALVVGRQFKANDIIINFGNVVR